MTPPRATGPKQKRPSAKKTPRSAKPQKEGSKQLNGLMRLMTTEKGKAIEFKISAEQGSRVYIAGTFNNWNPTTHQLEHHPEEGIFKATLFLPSGTHEYKFVVNGVWQADVTHNHWSTNEHGTLNSVITV